MKKVKIENWSRFGEYTVFSNIISKNKFGLIVEANSNEIFVFGNNGHLELFCKELDKLKIPYTTIP
jgi:hypothetical protein